MTDTTPILALPLLQPSQAQKHVTHNEALRVLEALVQAAVVSRTMASPPAEVAEGDRYIIALGASGHWAGKDGQIALRQEGAWAFLAPKPGWHVHVIDESEFVFWDGTEWKGTAEDLQQLAALGIGTTPDAHNRLAVASEASLFTNVGAGHRVVINKATNGDTASLILQTAFSGRAEIGLAGNDDISFKVSAAGETWTEAIKFSAITGHASGAAIQADALDSTAGRLMRTGAFGLGSSTLVKVQSLDTLGVTGIYSITTTSGGGTPTAGEWICFHIQCDATFATQEAQQKGGAGRWHRRRHGATWSGWQPVLQRETILGAVSQDAGQPTGAVIERGSNVGGDYVRFADGTQICIGRVTVDITTAAGGLFRSAPFAWVFPATFAPNSIVGGCSIQGRILHANGMCVNAPYGDRRTGTEDNRAFAIAPITGVGVQMVAMGRWF